MAFPADTIELEDGVAFRHGEGAACIEDAIPSSSASRVLSSGTSSFADLDTTDHEGHESAFPPADKGTQAWFFLLAAFVVEAILWSFPFAYGVFLESYLSDPTYTSQQNAASLLPLIGTVSSGIMYCAGAVVYPVIVKYPRVRRPAVWIGATLCASSLFGASFTTQIPALFALQGVIYAIGGSLLYFPTIFYMNEWFVRLRGTATGIMFAGTAAGGLILPLAFPRIIARYGAPKTLRYFAVAMAAMLLPVLPYIKGRLPARVYGPAPRSSKRDWLRNPSFWLYTVVNLIQGFAYFMPIVWLPTFASDLSLDSLHSAAVLAALNGASVVGGMVMGYLSDHFNAWLLALSSLVATALATFVLWGVLGNTFAGLIAFGIAYGIVAGSFSSLFLSFARMYAKEDPTNSTTLFGYISLGRGIGNVLSTPIATALTGMGSHLVKGATGFAVGGGRFESMILYTGTCFTGAAGLAVFGWRSEMWALRRQ
ncbi:MFS general substrate transporter [Schizophyllum commune H4-8]|nr:MFS general substrate transporter [Schizophyllum commune H4-8]KAI5896482.1 MFS general substrate transporter [Schizophyllum commune H4-8]